MISSFFGFGFVSISGFSLGLSVGQAPVYQSGLLEEQTRYMRSVVLENGLL